MFFSWLIQAALGRRLLFVAFSVLGLLFLDREKTFFGYLGEIN